MIIIIKDMEKQVDPKMNEKSEKLIVLILSFFNRNGWVKIMTSQTIKKMRENYECNWLQDKQIDR